MPADEQKPKRRRGGLGIEHALHRGPQLTMPAVDPHPEGPTPASEWARWMVGMMTDLAQSLNGVALQGALPVAVGVDAGGRVLPATVSRSAGRLLGYSLFETAGQLVTVHFHDTDSNTPTDGPDTWHEQVAASGVRTQVGMNVSFSAGLCLEFAGSGTVRGIVLLSGVD